jgi:hypothetical protein
MVRIDDELMTVLDYLVVRRLSLVDHCNFSRVVVCVMSRGSRVGAGRRGTSGRFV